MTDAPPDDARLRATEAQMRYALGLDNNSTERSRPNHPAIRINGSPPPRRRFVHDGEVPVSVIHRDETSGTNQLESARQTIRSLTAAKEHAERSLAEALATIQHLRTELAHERLAKDEAIQRAESERQIAQQSLRTLEAELAAERQARRDAENAVIEALRGRQDAEEQLRESMAVQHAHSPSRASGKRKATDTPQGAVTVLVAKANSGTKVGNRRGPPPKVADVDADIVEWWVPGWREKFR